MVDVEKNSQNIIQAKAEEIAAKVYPAEWFTSDKHLFGAQEFRIDQNAGKRGVAVEVAKHFLTIMDSEYVAKRLTKAFVRRYAGEEAAQQLELEYCHMLTAMLSVEMALKNCDSIGEEAKPQ